MKVGLENITFRELVEGYVATAEEACASVAARLSARGA